jgi:hypothetical protein
MNAGAKTALDDGYQTSVTSHQCIVAGLTPGATYPCQVSSSGTFSAYQNVTTSAAQTRTPITKVSFGASTSINVHGDDNQTFVSNDNNTYIVEDDGYGFVTGVPNAGANMQIGVLTNESTLVGTLVNLLTNYGGYGSSNGTDGPGGVGMSNKQTGLFGMAGNLFIFQNRSVGPTVSANGIHNDQEYYGNVMMSTDHGVTWNSWQAPATFNANGVPPNPLGSYQFANGNIGTITPVRYAVDDGTFGYNTAGNQIDGANAYVYITYQNQVLINADALYLMRWARYKFYQQDATAVQYWSGPAVPGTADFVNDANWASTPAGATPILNAPGRVSFNDMVFVPVLNSYLLLNWRYTQNCDQTGFTTNSVWEVCAAPTPAGPWTVITTIVNPTSGWYNPRPQHRTVASNVASHDIAVQIIYTGDYAVNFATYYYPTYSTLTLNPNAGSATMQQLITDNFNRNENPLAGNWGVISSYGNLQAISGTGAAAAVAATNSNECWVGPGGVSADGNWANDQYSECTVGLFTGPVSIGPGARMGTGGTGYIASMNSGASSGGTVYKLTGSGGYTSIGTILGTTTATGDVWRIQIVGTTITVLQNGVSRFSTTDATYASGNPGLYLFSQASCSCTLFAAGANQAATPTFSPPGGFYTAPQTVTITCSNGGTIYYTTDGSTPTHSSSSIASGSSISVTPTKTVKAIASVADFADSVTGTAAYIGGGGNFNILWQAQHVNSMQNSGVF